MFFSFDIILLKFPGFEIWKTLIVIREYDDFYILVINITKEFSLRVCTFFLEQLISLVKKSFFFSDDQPWKRDWNEVIMMIWLLCKVDI